ncbi:glycosyltransferase family 25 protein [Zavarzinella formosa]|uniref:glycosyltransferase family 25 protein n=1 Tax=Zavarzinella formosa TaxID=360055 RepID=UPI00031F61CB|nr:glycosyltransferase family 25 protein [Zavarzinella formosa]
MFDSIYLINLKRRPDRLANFRAMQLECGWGLPEPIIFEAIEGDRVGVPPYFSQGGGAWGCLRSHVSCLERALMDGVDSVLMLEDDVTWRSDAWDRLGDFMRTVPADWDQLMLGGQHIGQHGGQVAQGVVKCRDCERTHGYAIKLRAIRSLLAEWYTCGVHCDWAMGRRWQKTRQVYAPEEFIFGQAGGRSDISGRINPVQFWVQPKDIPVVHLTCPPDVIKKLRGYGLHTGHDRDAHDLDKGLARVARLAQKDVALRKWLDTILWECASDVGSIATVYHPQISLADVRKIHPTAASISGSTVEEILGQLNEARIPTRPNFSATHAMIFRGPRKVAEGLSGFHMGNWRDSVSGHDHGLRAVAAATGSSRSEKLQEWFLVVGSEGERSQKIPLLWHPEITADEAAAATERKVVEVTADSVEDALAKWKEGR